ncbi:unknown [Ruminococcus sp. CAG:177]|nr:unknown [Ruminococcus sp. CAG:177]
MMNGMSLTIFLPKTEQNIVTKRVTRPQMIAT